MGGGSGSPDRDAREGADRGTVRVVVGIITYRRPDSLGHCLGSLAKLAPPEGAEVEVVVVDNDADRSA